MNTVSIKRYGYHLHHSAIGLLSCLVLMQFLSPLYSCILSGTVFLFIKKLIFEKPSEWQTYQMYLKDLFTDWIEYQTVWMLYFQGLTFWVLLVSIFILYFIFVIKFNWSYP